MVIRADGGGDKTGGVGTGVYQNDTFFVGPESSAATTFIDATLMTLDGNSAVTIDELVYDSAGQDSLASFDFAGGLLGLVSGDIAKSGDMVVTTAVSTIGIRGTTLLVKAVGVFRAANGQIKVTLLAINDDTGQPQVIALTADANGNLGSITVTTGGETRTLTQANATLTVSANGRKTQGVLDAIEVANMFSAAAAVITRKTDNDLNAPGVADISTDDDETGALHNLLNLLEENPSQDAGAD